MVDRIDRRCLQPLFRNATRINKETLPIVFDIRELACHAPSSMREVTSICAVPHSIISLPFLRATSPPQQRKPLSSHNKVTPIPNSSEIFVELANLANKACHRDPAERPKPYNAFKKNYRRVFCAGKPFISFIVATKHWKHLSNRLPQKKEG